MVARHSLESIPSGITNVMDLDENCKNYHVSCYQLFTNKEKLQRAKKSNTNAQAANTGRTMWGGVIRAASKKIQENQTSTR